jgi:hypothetical protein
MKLKMLAKATMIAIAAGALSGCFTKVEFVSPADDSVHNTAPDLIFNFDKLPTSFKILLNNEDISDLLTISGSTGTISGSTIASSPALLEGDNEISVNGNRVDFNYDVVGPELRLSQIASDEMLALRTDVAGCFDDAIGTASAAVKGASGADKSITLVDNCFTLNNLDNSQYWDASGIMTFTAYDRYRQLSKTSYIGYAAEAAEALSARISSTGLEFISTAISDYIEATGWTSIIKGSDTYLYEKSGLLDMALKLDRASSTATSVSLTEKSTSSIQVAVSIEDFVMDTQVLFKVFGTYGDGVNVEIRGDVEAKVSASLAANSSGGIDVTIGSTSIELENGAITLGDRDWRGTEKDGIVEAFIEEAIINIALPKIESKLKAKIQEKLDEKLETLATSLAVTVLDESFDLDFGFNDIKVDTRYGGLRLGLDSNITTSSLSGAVNQIYASRYVQPSSKVIPSTTPDGGKSYDAAGLLSLNIVNKAILSGYLAGSLNSVLVESDMSSTAWKAVLKILGLYQSGLTNLGSNQELVVRLIPESVPHVATLDGEDSVAQVVANDLVFKIQIREQSFSASGLFTYTDILELKVDGRVGIDIGTGAMDENDRYTVSVDISDDPALTRLKIKSYVSGNEVEWASELLESTASLLLPFAIDLVNSQIEAIPLPVIGEAGYSAQLVEVWNHDDTHIGVAVNFKRD